jgi:hypothetical protein
MGTVAAAVVAVVVVVVVVVVEVEDAVVAVVPTGVTAWLGRADGSTWCPRSSFLLVVSIAPSVVMALALSGVPFGCDDTSWIAFSFI